MDPPMVAVALDNRSDLLEIIRGNGRFAVNVLSAHQTVEAQTFAGKGRDKFDGVNWELHNDSPRLYEVSSWAACEDASFTPGGDHTIVSGVVISADSEPRQQPLTYHRRVFGTHAAGTASQRNAHVR
jgi:flavin reductase (DIM6/NTAB) family NADH-FMN oxidoreductase RutF